VAPAVFKTVQPGQTPGGWVRFPHAPASGSHSPGPCCPPTPGNQEPASVTRRHLTDTLLIAAGAFEYRSPLMTRVHKRFTGAAYRTLVARVGTGLLTATLLTVGSAMAQEAPPTPQATADTIAQAPIRRGVSPRGAFLRAVAVPGWGHSAIGSYRRGAFYFVAEGITAWGLIKTRERIKEANQRVDFRETRLLADLAAQGVTDPTEIQTALDDDEALTDLLALQGARKSQREDWTALGIFLLLLSGADAYVSAHLQHFPAPLTLDTQSSGNGRMDVSLSIKLPN
jgi:hypothetical protein